MLLFFLVYSSLHAYCIEETDTLFKITKIKTKGDYYVIQAVRNDSLFKIISKKIQIDKPNLELLKKGEYYYFDFGNANNKIAKEKTDPLSGIANYSDVKNKSVFIDGDTKIRFTKRFHYRLYTTKNLIGLFYTPSPP